MRGSLFGWLVFNVTSTQIGHFVMTLFGMDKEHRERDFVLNSKMNWKPVKTRGHEHVDP